MLFLALALALCIVFWARELYGTEAAIAAVVLFCFDPNLIAHASIVQTDVPFALFFFASTYFFWRSLKELSWFNLLMTAALFALASVTKFSFLAILPAWFLVGLVKIMSSEPLNSPHHLAFSDRRPLEKSGLREHHIHFRSDVFLRGDLGGISVPIRRSFVSERPVFYC